MRITPLCYCHSSNLAKVVAASKHLAVSRYFEREGIKLYQLAESNNLEGIVSKRKDNLYYPDKRTKDWIKSKNLLDDDFLICGYIPKGQGTSSDYEYLLFLFL